MDEMFLNPTREKRSKIAECFEKYSDRITSLRLGRSLLGEEIKLYKIGEGRTNILYVGAHHGSEHLTASLLYNFLLIMVKNKEKYHNIDLELYLKSYSLFVVPMLNTDGVELSLRGGFENPLRARQERMAKNGIYTDWQANARGVDLNHNYSYGFEKYKEIELEEDITPGKTLYSGEYPESEPETKALANLIRSVDFSLVVSLHSQGEEIYYFPENEKVKRIAKSAEEKLGYSISTPDGTASYGGLCDYTGCELSIPSLTIEIGKGKNPLPENEYHRIKERLSKLLFLLPTEM